MAVRQSALLRGGAVAIGQSVFLSPNFPEDFTTNKGVRFLLGGKLETDNTKFDTSIFGFVSAGSLTSEIKGAARKYIRIS